MLAVYLLSDGLIAHYFDSFMMSKHGTYRDTEVKVHHISTSVQGRNNV